MAYRFMNIEGDNQINDFITLGRL